MPQNEAIRDLELGASGRHRIVVEPHNDQILGSFALAINRLEGEPSPIALGTPNAGSIDVAFEKRQ